MPDRLPAILLAVHLLYFFLLPSVSARAVSAIGCLACLAWLAGSVRARAGAGGPGSRDADARGWSPVPLALFALPLVSLLVQPTAGFWRMDGRALLIVAWLGALAWWLWLRETSGPDTSPSAPHRRGLPLLTQLVILWSALFWVTVIWDVGMGQAVALVTREDRLLTSFALWETRPASEHLFLVWLNRESFESGVAYSNHLHPILFFLYGCSKAVQLATGLPLYVGRNLTPFAMAALGVLAFTALVPRPSRRAAHGLGFHAALFLALGFFLTEWHAWIYPFTWGFDTVFPVIAYLAAIVWACAYPRVSGPGTARLTAAVVLFAAFGWLYTPLLVLGLWCVFGRMQRGVAATMQANRALVVASIAGLVTGLVVYALPLLLIAMSEYQNTSSSFVFRSGLDGDTRYFQNVIQAVVHPFRPARAWWTLVFPAAIPLIVTVVSVAKWPVARRRIGRMAAFLLAPYLFSLALFPQSVSIHPNLYDPLLLIPVVLIGTSGALAQWVRRRRPGYQALAAVLVATILIVANLIAIAQGVRPLVAGPAPSASLAR